MYILACKAIFMLWVNQDLYRYLIHKENKKRQFIKIVFRYCMAEWHSEEHVGSERTTRYERCS